MLSPIVLLFTLVACMADEAPQVAPEMVRKLIPTPVDPKTLAAPIILIHGYVGSKAYVQGRNVTFPPHLSHCVKNWDFQKAWISPLLAMNFDSRLTDPPQACLLHMLSLKYDPAKKQFEEQQNVDVTFLGEDQFGSVMPMSCLLFETRVGCGFSAGAKLDESSFMPVVDFLEAEHGYKQGVNLFGASYDWRRTANMPEMDAYFTNLTKLVERAVETTGKKAFLMTHSMGNLIANYYLNHRVDEKWQKKYLNGTINVSAPWGGSMVVLEQLLRGNMNRLQMGGSLMIKDSTIRDFVSSLASSAVLVPSSLAFPADQTLIMVNGTKYGTKEMDEILKLAGVPQFSTIYHELNEHVEAQKHTPMYCVHSIFGNNTPIAYNYPAGYKPDDHPEVTLGLGDNMVNLESLRVCNKWQEQGKLVKSVVEIQGPSHMGILHDDNFYRAIETIVGLQKIRG